uniref:Uncharacterized protein n=1 Tax=Solanum lycopersicum TaxID=4081 RepID=K4C628_SOLLC
MRSYPTSVMMLEMLISSSEVVVFLCYCYHCFDLVRCGVWTVILVVMLLELDFDDIDASTCTGRSQARKRRRASINCLEASNLPVLSLEKRGGSVFKGYCFSCALKVVGVFLLRALGTVSFILNKIMLTKVLVRVLGIWTSQVPHGFHHTTLSVEKCNR